MHSPHLFHGHSPFPKLSLYTRFSHGHPLTDIDDHQGLGAQEHINECEAPTLSRLFAARVAATPDQEAYRAFEAADNTWRSWTWREAEWEAGKRQAVLMKLGLKAGERMALMLPNGPEWAFFDLAALGMGLITVPLFANDRPENAAYVLEHSGSRVLITDTAQRWRDIRKALSAHSGLEHTVLLEDTIASRNTVGLKSSMPAESAPYLSSAPAPFDLATLCYTSGTTGRPKGVMLSHRAILSNARACGECGPCENGDHFLSFLPLSHMLERTVGYYLPMLVGATVCYSRGLEELAEDLTQLKPTHLVCVPRLFEKISARLDEKLNQGLGIKSCLFKTAEAIGWYQFEYQQGRKPWHQKLLLWPLLQLLVANKVKQKLGGQLKIAISGGAPLATNIARRFIGLGVPLVQGYGMTELGPVVSVNRLNDHRPETVGSLLPNIEIRIGAEQELLIRSPAVMTGYWNNKQATQEIIDPQGWLHTGDRAEWKQEQLRITGRLKDILVLSNGEKLAPTDIEQTLMEHPLIDQVLIYVDSTGQLSAHAVLNPLEWAQYCKQHQIDTKDINEQLLIKKILKTLNKCLHAFPGYTHLENVHVSLKPWTVENGLLTPTLKPRRHQIMSCT